MIDPDQLASVLDRRPRRVSDAPGRAAAVLLGLSRRHDALRVLLIKRTESLRHHGGQYALPGGGRDPEDPDLVATALREAHEEVGLAPRDVRVLGLLDDLVTVTDFVVTPVVGWIPADYVFTPNPHEVALVVELPLAAFLETPTVLATVPGAAGRTDVLAYTVDGHVIWGATAQILRDFVAIAVAGP